MSSENSVEISDKYCNELEDFVEDFETPESSILDESDDYLYTEELEQLDAYVRLKIYPLARKFSDIENETIEEFLDSDDKIILQTVDKNSLNVIVKGGNKPYKYRWILPDDTIIEESHIEPELEGEYTVEVSDSSSPEKMEVIKSFIIHFNSQPFINFKINSNTVAFNEIVNIHQRCAKLDMDLNIGFLKNDDVGYIIYLNENEIISGAIKLKHGTAILDFGYFSFDLFPSYLEIIIFSPNTGEIIDKCFLTIKRTSRGHFSRNQLNIGNFVEKKQSKNQEVSSLEEIKIVDPNEETNKQIVQNKPKTRISEQLKIKDIDDTNHEKNILEEMELDSETAKILAYQAQKMKRKTKQIHSTCMGCTNKCKLIGKLSKNN